MTSSSSEVSSAKVEEHLATSPTPVGDLPRQRATKPGTGYRKQIGTTLEEAFKLSTKGKW